MATTESQSGTLTLLFTDIEGSTAQWEQAHDTMRDALAVHDEVLREAIAKHGGHVFKTLGDAFCVAFQTASEAAACAIEAQRNLNQIGTLRVRMAISSGTVVVRENDYFGPSVNRAARLLSIAHGGQVILTTVTANLIQGMLPAGASLLDLGRHRLRGIDEPEGVLQLSHSDLPSDFPPLLSPQNSVYNLPRQLAAFVGRDHEADAWQELLRDPARRLVTLTGFGGIGKTRMAMLLAELCLDDFADGVWWCELEEARTAEEMVVSLATQLRLPPQNVRSPKEQLHQFLREKNLLIVLDNTEQVPQAPAVVRDLLQDAPGVRCLVTSRRALELRGETVLEMSPLSEAESLTLFVARASECQPDFALDDDNHDDVVELCRRLEGVPLAIELASARIVGMSPRQILQRLGERFRLLQSRSPLPSRQRAIRGTIDWSFELLSDDDKDVFAQISVFAGGFTIDDAEQVCEAFDVFESVIELRRHSFFRVVTDPHTQETRFHLSDLLREYGAEKLAESSDGGAETRLRHARHFRDFALQRLEKLRSADEAAAMQVLRLNAANLRAALENARRADDRPLWGEIALCVGRMWQRLGFVQDAVTAIESGIDAVRNLDDASSLIARLREERAGLHFDLQEAQPAKEAATDALERYQSLGDKLGSARASNLLGQVALLERDYDAARELLTETLKAFQDVGDRVGIAIALNNLGVADRRDQSGSPEAWVERADRAGRHFAESLEIRREIEDARGIAETVNNLGVLAHERAERLRDSRESPEREADLWAEAAGHYDEAIRRYDALGDTLGLAYSLANRGEVAQNRRDFGHGARLYLLAIELLDAVRSPIAATVRTMLDTMCADAGIPPADRDALAREVARLPSETRVEWALTPPAPPK